MSAPPKSEGAARQDSPHTRHDLRSTARYQNPGVYANISAHRTERQVRGLGGGKRLLPGWHVPSMVGRHANA